MFREWFNGSTGGGGRFARSVPDLAPPMTPGGVIRYASLGVVPASCLLQSSQAVRLCFSLSLSLSSFIRVSWGPPAYFGMFLILAFLFLFFCRVFYGTAFLLVLFFPGRCGGRVVIYLVRVAVLRVPRGISLL